MKVRSARHVPLKESAAAPCTRPETVFRFVVSAGQAVGVKADGFASEVLLDPEWTVSSALGPTTKGADGTPMAVLVSADRRIDSDVAGGGPAVLEFLGAGELAASRH